jgi:hypothetical protein
MGYSIQLEELFPALFHRRPSPWEISYWRDEMKYKGFESVFRRMTRANEHKRFSNDRELMFVPAGHFYSPIVDQEFINARHDAIFAAHKELDGIDLREEEQLSFVEKIAETTPLLPFEREPVEGLRYHYGNNAFVSGDAIVYASMLFAHKPPRILEVGSGYSSALALDVCDLIPDYRPEIRFIDPYPQLVRNLVSKNVSANVSIEERFVQDIPPENLSYLEAGDFYFMDTTHIVKTGSDVLYHFEEILPRLSSGVIVHLHDIFYPMEYPEAWVTKDRLSWNEIYYFRAFLTNNPDYEILFWNNFMHRNHLNLMETASLEFAYNGGASIWFRKK